MNEHYFYSLVTPKSPTKKRLCLNCRTPFVPHSYGNRICGQCNLKNGNASVSSTYQIWENKKIKA